MEARKEEFRTYLHESGVINALTKSLVKLYELKKTRPVNAIAFIQKHMDESFPSLTDYQNLLIELEESRKLLAGNTLGATGSSQFDYANLTIDDAKKRLEELKADATCKSLLVAHLTVAMLESLKDTKTQNGMTILDCIKSGLQYSDSYVGIYAADADAYEKFADIFNLIISDYHKHDPASALLDDQKDNWDDATSSPAAFEDLNAEFGGDYIKSTRITCARSIKDFPLNPSMTEDQYLNVMNAAKTALCALANDLEGDFLELEGMDAAKQEELFKNCLLFAPGDKHLTAAGALKCWPKGRGIYMLKSDPPKTTNTLFAWVNGEDHLKFISMDEGGNIEPTYTRLKDAVTQCSSLEFQVHNRLGFVTFRPANLGTAIQASVTMNLPKLTGAGVLERVAENNNLRILDAPVPEIASKESLGLTEYETVKAFWDRLKILIAAEQIYANPNLTIEKAKELLTTHKSDANCKSLLIKHLTVDMLENHKDTVTMRGKTLLDCIKTGLENPDSSFGIYAVDADAYDKFSDIFNLIISDYHKHDSAKTLSADQKDNWDGDGAAFDDLSPSVTSIKIKCTRSIATFPLNASMTGKDYADVMKEVKDLFATFQGDLEGEFVDLDGMDEAVKETIVKHLSFDANDPNGRGIFKNTDANASQFLVGVNEEDHLKFVTMDDGGDITAAYDRLKAIVTECSNTLKFQVHNRLGFLTFCPTNLGSTIFVSVAMNLPNLEAAATLETFADDNNLQISPILDESSQPKPGEYEVSSKQSLGLAERETVKAFWDNVKKLKEEEEAAPAP